VRVSSQEFGKEYIATMVMDCVPRCHLSLSSMLSIGYPDVLAVATSQSIPIKVLL
jgi:hypothetical protein